jgi:hypothetical protein
MIQILLAAVCLGGGYPTNLDLVEAAVEEACSSLAETIAQQGIDTFTIEIEGEHPANWLVEQTIEAVLTGRGLTVTAGREGTSNSILSIRPMDLAVRYGNTSRSWIFGKKRVERIAICELSSTLVDSEGTIIVSIRSGAEDSDLVPVSELDVLEGAEDWNWLSEGEISGDGGGILEPLVVTGVVASLIYLFYSSRAE